MASEYKNTLNLPKTDFPIKANSAKIEEEYRAFWAEKDIYHKLLENNEKNDKYILHDGPPYPNGDIHLGHALNKILKDIIVKYKAMSGYFAPYIPGWDCHGLPIETQLIKELGDKHKEMNKAEFREKCRDYALKYVELQKNEFKNLGIFGEWDNPYLTLDKVYESKIVEVFGSLAEGGYVYRGLKPIHWCPSCETALAEAELEYEDEKSPSIYVKFETKNELGTFFVIWTTTPWTLPANVAVAANADFEYVYLKPKEPRINSQVPSDTYVIAEGLLEDFVKRLEIKDYEVIKKAKGSELEGTPLKHPFLDREVKVILGGLVTLEQGTGLVHIAPGHGIEDYQAGLKYKLPIVMPVDAKGHFDNSVPEFIAGMYYDKANKVITEKMKADGTLLKLEFIKHSYPHCWRCKKPVIFRATEQWFISVDHNDMRAKALEAIGQVKWYPGWGENRIRGMINTRPDWCISRQRSWGVPIPAFYCETCGKPQTKGVFNKSIAELFKKEGSDAWFKKDAIDILPNGTKCPDCGGIEFKKETDILDVWFESGVSHAAVLETRENLSWPADLYLEGSDQHRGWFQSSLLTSIGYKEKAPFKAVLTHGFTVDDTGKKMSKSLGNVINPQEVLKVYGADVLRLWVASTDFRNDMAASQKILKQVQEAFSKIRNTCRFLLSNLNDFTEPVPYDELLELDKWILLKLQNLVEKVNSSYENFEFHVVYHSLYSFCSSDLSSLYLDMSKDRLYCGGKDSKDRKSAQTAMNEILNTLMRLMAPILSFTAEDLNKYYQGKESVFTLQMPKAKKEYLNNKLEEKWSTILSVRENVYRSLEEARAAKQISSSLEAEVKLSLDGNEYEALKAVENILPIIFIVSKVSLIKGPTSVVVAPAAGKKCERCWMILESVGENSKHPALCKRCASVV